MEHEQATPLNPERAFTYMGELLSEYMKTLPDPIRAPVVNMLNHCTAIIANELNDVVSMREQVTKLGEEIGNLKKRKK